MNLQPLIEDLGIDKMSPEQQEKQIASLIRTLNNRMSVRMAADLTEEQMSKLEAVAGKGDEASLEELEQAHPGFMQMYQEEIDKLREDFKTMRSQN